jgi:hypothetical protein
MKPNFIPEYCVEWGQFVDLDMNNNESIQKQKKCKKRMVETYNYNYLEKLDEECGRKEIEETKVSEKTQKKEETQEKQTLFTISIPFSKKKMRFHLEKPRLFSYFSFTILSMAAFIFIYKPYNSDNY